MRRTFLLALFALLALPAALHAQASDKFRIGPRIGVNYAGSKNDPNSSSTTTAKGVGGLIAGLITEKNLFGPLYWSSEILYVERKFEDPDLIVPQVQGSDTIQKVIKWAQTLAQLQTPTYLKIKFAAKDYIPYALVGVNLGFKLSAETVFDTAQLKVNDPRDDPYKFLDVSVDVGAGMEFVVTKFMSIIVDARYTYGLSEVRNFYETGDTGNDLSTRDMKLMAGVTFGL